MAAARADGAAAAPAPAQPAAALPDAGVRAGAGAAGGHSCEAAATSRLQLFLAAQGIEATAVAAPAGAAGAAAGPTGAGQPGVSCAEAEGAGACRVKSLVFLAEGAPLVREGFWCVWHF